MAGVPTAGEASITAALAGTLLRADHAAADGMAAEPDLSIAIVELRPSFSLGLARGVAAELHVPFRLLRVEALGGGGGVADEETSTRIGIVDPWLLGRLATEAGPWTFGTRVGVSVPLGRHPANAEHGTGEQYARFGRGTFNPVAAIDGKLRLAGVDLDAWLLGIVVPYEASDGYRAPHRFGGGAGASSGLGLAAWRFRLGMETSVESSERWHGARPAEGNRGRTDVIATAGIRWTSGPVTFGLDARVPLWVHVVGEDLSYPLLLELRVEPRLRLWSAAGRDDDHGHGHDHGHDHGHGRGAAAPDPLAIGAQGLDVAELSVDGEDVPLTPVAGKVTVFDFWASWCVPCEELGRRLAELGRRHPGRLAVRRLRVETWDRPAARHWLAETPSLPHVRVVGPDGSLEFARSGSPEEIAEAIEAALAE